MTSPHIPQHRNITSEATGTATDPTFCVLLPVVNHFKLLNQSFYNYITFMKKFFFLSLIAFQSILGSAQGVDPAVYPVKEGYTLQNLWLYAAGNGVDGVAISDWNELADKMANPGKATMAARLGDYVYISCSQDYKVGEDGATVVDHGGHLLVLEAATGRPFEDQDDEGGGL